METRSSPRISFPEGALDVLVLLGRENQGRGWKTLAAILLQPLHPREFSIFLHRIVIPT